MLQKKHLSIKQTSGLENKNKTLQIKFEPSNHWQRTVSFQRPRRMVEPNNHGNMKVIFDTKWMNQKGVCGPAGGSVLRSHWLEIRVTLEEPDPGRPDTQERLDLQKALPLFSEFLLASTCPISSALPRALQVPSKHLSLKEEWLLWLVRVTTMKAKEKEVKVCEWPDLHLKNSYQYLV